MSEMEDVVDRALRVVGGVAAPEGMAERVLRRVSTREGAEAGVSGWGVTGRLIWAGVLGVVVIGVVVHGYRHGADGRGAGRGRVRANVSDAGRGVAGAAVSQHGGVGVVKIGRAGRPAPRRAIGFGGRKEEGPRVSYPAPEAPLTEQERMLLALAKAREPAVVEALDPVYVARVRAEEERALERFFDAKKTGEME